MPEDKIQKWAREVNAQIGKNPFRDRISFLMQNQQLAFISVTNTPIPQPNSFGTLLHILCAGNLERPDHVSAQTMEEFLRERCKLAEPDEKGNIVAFYNKSNDLKHCGLYLGALSTGEDIMFHMTYEPIQEFESMEINKFLVEMSAVNRYKFYQFPNIK